MNSFKQILMKFLEKLTPKCDLISEKISKSMDEKISLKDQLQIKLHLLYCSFCTRYRDQIVMIHKMLEESDQTMTDIKLTPLQKDRLKSRLNNLNS